MSTATTTDSADFYELEALLDDDERAFLRNVRDFMTSRAQPIVNRHWQRGSFPFEIVPGFRQLAGRTALPRIRLWRAVVSSRRNGGDGTGPHRPLDRHLLRGPLRTVDGHDLSVRQPRAEATLPAGLPRPRPTRATQPPGIDDALQPRRRPRSWRVRGAGRRRRRCATIARVEAPVMPVSGNSGRATDANR